jgi:pectate lyase-like protein
MFRRRYRYRSYTLAIALFGAADPGLSSDGQRRAIESFAEVTESPYNAKGDAIADDTTAIQMAIDVVSKGGGTVGFPRGVYRTTRALAVQASNVSLSGDGAAKIRFEPKAPFAVAANDRALILGRQDGLSMARLVSGGPIAIGARRFKAASPSETADLVPGDWIVVRETDPGVGGEIVWIDWLQVDTVAGAVVTVQSPFRMTFPNNHAPSSLRFQKVLNPVENITVRDLAIEAPSTTEPVVGVAVAVARGVLLNNVEVNVANGNGYFSYRSAQLTLQNCRQLRTFTQSTEFAATVGLRLLGSTFGVVGTRISRAPANTSALALDYGTAFFQVVGNEIINGGNILLQLNYGVHDGVIANNVFGWSRDSTIGKGQGISAVGAQNVLVNGNILVGGDGSFNTGIAFASSANLKAQILSKGNLIGPNIIRNFARPYGSMLDTDSYMSVPQTK